ncbi:MAG TPA: hypothetical protein VEV41_03090 [Terriglobales bacterium]|nr:hypothetical protein [Terriglobales bacterium]
MARARTMKELKIKYVDRMPRPPEHLPLDVVEVYIGSSGITWTLALGGTALF